MVNWWLDLLCLITPKATMIYNSFFSDTMKQAISFVEAWESSVKGVICESRLQQIAHTVKFTKLANVITLKRPLIALSQKLVTAYTRPQVRIVSFNFSDNFNIKLNTTMNVNRSQKHGPILHYITQAKSRTIKITVMHHILIHYNLESVKNPYFCIYFQCEKLTGNEVFLG